MLKRILIALGLKRQAAIGQEKPSVTPYFYQKTKDYPAVDIVTPFVQGTASDSASGRLQLGSRQGIPDAIGEWFASQTAIPAAQASWLSRHWLISKAVSMPAEDAIRQGWEVDTADGEIVAAVEMKDKKRDIKASILELVSAARRTGGALALFRTCPEGEDEAAYYAAPLNIDAVTDYAGVAIVDASDAVGEIISDSISDPAALRYMKPEFYRIGNKRYHHSHVVECVPYPVSNRLKATYGYWGQSVAERIFSRVYAAERTADEAPLLAMTKRIRALGVDLSSVINDGGLDTLIANVRGLQEMADNLGVFVYDTASGGGLSQIDTSLGDLESTIMTQYQLVASIAEVPATKLLGTAPIGFNATGESEAEDYRQLLESIQTTLMEPALNMHYKLLLAAMRLDSDIAITWAPLDSPTAQEFASIDAQNAATVSALVAQMIIPPSTAAAILGQSKDSIFYGVLEKSEEEDASEVEAFLDEIEKGQPGSENESL